MKPAPFDYVAPEDLGAAVTALCRSGGDAKILAGGQSLVPLLNMRLARPKLLIDLNRIAGLDGIGETNGGLWIGAMTRQSRVERSTLVRERCPVLAEAVGKIGHAAIRHRGTIGGSMAHADPAAELPAVALALGARFVAVGEAGERRIASDDFFVDYLTTALRADEILTAIVFPVARGAMGHAVEEITRRHGDFAIAGVIATVELDEGGRISTARVAAFGVAPIPIRAHAVEQALSGREPGEKVIREAAALLESSLEPHDDTHATGSYRKRVAGVLAARAITRAAAMCRKQTP